MKQAHRFMDAITLHYYTIPGSWSEKGSATGFPESEWTITLRKALHMEELITRHSAIMDQYDPDKRIGLIVDEWGTWYDVEPGTNPGFLYQQNTIRDALVAGITLHVFHRHSDRVRMANIAQLVNVLQSVVLTEGERMLLTPTYHVFDLFKVHQDAELLDLHEAVDQIGSGREGLPQISASASRDAEGRIHLSLCNLDHQSSATVAIELRGWAEEVILVNGSILASEQTDGHNTFDTPDRVAPATFTDFTVAANRLTANLPPMSVAVLELTSRQ